MYRTRSTISEPRDMIARSIVRDCVGRRTIRVRGGFVFDRRCRCRTIVSGSQRLRGLDIIDGTSGHVGDASREPDVQGGVKNYNYVSYFF